MGITNDANRNKDCTIKYGGKLSQALYRKWRPATFGELFGQEHIKTTLSNVVLKNKIVHAYLFSGPRGSGKTTTARIFAKAINCQNPKNGEPCNKCVSCTSILKGNNLDFIEIDAASTRGIEDIKDLREKVKFAPSSLKYKVFVIDEVHMLTREAFNALLKTLEEPPAHAIFILATTEAHKIPATIISRCQRHDFKRLNISDLTKRLTYIAKKEKIEIDEKALEIIARAAYGSARDAESLLDLIVARGIKKITKETVEEILGKTDLEKMEKLYSTLINKDSNSALALINEISEQGADILQFSINFLDFLRDKMIESPSREIALWIKNIAQAQKEIKTAILPQLPLELAIVEITSREQKEELPDKIQNKEENKEEKPQKPTPKSMPCNIDWNEVIRQIKPHNHSLCFLLKSSEPLEIEDNKLILRVDYKFHKDKLEEQANRKIIEEVLKNVTGNNLRIYCKVIKKASNATKDRDNKLVRDVEEVFNEDI